MAYQVPNADAVAYPAMARLFSSDLAIVEYASEGYAVQNGCDLTTGTNAGTVKVNAGNVYNAGSPVAVSAQDNIAAAANADGSNPKWQLIEIDSSGNVQTNVGTAGTNPEPPTPTASRTVIAALYIPASATTVDAASLNTANGHIKIIDKRMFGLIQSDALGWKADTNTWTYASATTYANTFTISGDHTARLKKGTRIKLTQTTVKYFVVIASSFSSSTTTVTINGGDDYTLANATISNTYYSFEVSPAGYPDWFNWTPTLSVGWGSAPTNTVYRFRVVGNTCFTSWRQATNGQSNSTTARQMTLPITAATITNAAWIGYGIGADNGAALTTPVRAQITSAATIVQAYPNPQAGNWTAGNTGCAVTFDIHYEI